MPNLIDWSLITGWWHQQERVNHYNRCMWFQDFLNKCDFWRRNRLPTTPLLGFSTFWETEVMGQLSYVYVHMNVSYVRFINSEITAHSSVHVKHENNCYNGASCCFCGPGFRGLFCEPHLAHNQSHSRLLSFWLAVRFPCRTNLFGCDFGQQAAMRITAGVGREVK